MVSKTVTMFTCDRCGWEREYDPSRQGYVYLVFNNEAVLGAVDPIQTTLNPNSDICSKCFNDFQKFWKAGNVQDEADDRRT